MVDPAWATNGRPRNRRKWLWIGFCLAIFAIVVIVVVVPSVVVTRNNRNNATPPPYAKAVSYYANLTRVRTYHHLDQKDRVFIIGDVHGCADELKQLVEKIQYNQDRDQIILAGDLVYRGPDNVGVIRYAKEIGALCVRGNHDDVTIRFKTYEIQHGLQAMQNKDDIMREGDVADPLKFSDDHMDIVKNMTQEDYDYLVNCPLVIDLPTLNNSRVVHGGLDPEIEKPVNNDPYWVVNMRNMDKDGDPERTKSNGKHWTKYWAEAQHAPNNTTPINIYYGHDAGRGLNLESETFGTDSGCVYGHQLTALEMKTHQLTQVDCQEYS
ncbi:Metallo-dependent phosphatase-like protein [Phascolomyces articulosus]|uniref:Metallo-dependent phosphatase-like protein n=1 Tax=Phascolomyces articulosus TaxID=60185 RepID=A0AAD5PGT2_9FUNG|nr:Metallo-dependent phosphatase-like protein [Phascolomyces articulosus]